MQVAASVGQEGDATPFTQVTVDNISSALHKCGYQSRGWEVGLCFILFYLILTSPNNSLNALSKQPLLLGAVLMRDCLELRLGQPSEPV